MRWPQSEQGRRYLSLIAHGAQDTGDQLLHVVPIKFVDPIFDTF